VMGPLGVEGLVSIGIAVGSVVALVVLVALRGAGRRARLEEIDGLAADAPEWPDPSTRPRF